VPVIVESHKVLVPYGVQYVSGVMRPFCDFFHILDINPKTNSKGWYRTTAKELFLP